MDFTTVFVTVGTTRFDRLISSVTDTSILKILIGRGCKKLILQIGAGNEPNFDENDLDLKVAWYRFKPNISEDISQANLIIAHAGAGTCLDVLSVGRPLVVVVNEDLMDSHQDELAIKLDSLNFLAYARPSELAETLIHLDLSSLKPYKPGNPSVFALFIDSVVGVST